MWLKFLYSHWLVEIYDPSTSTGTWCLSWWYSDRPGLQPSSLLASFFFFVFSLVLCKLITYSGGLEVRWVGQSRTLHNLGPTKSPLLLWLDVKDHGPADIALFDEFWCLHLDLSTLHISTVVLLLLSGVKLSMNSSEMTSLAAMDTQAMTSPPPCLTNEVVRHGLWAVSILSFHHSGTGQPVHNTLIQNCNLVFLRFASCGEPAEVILV